MFGSSGLVLASWASRLPDIREKLEVTTERLGVLLLLSSFASFVTLPLAGAIIRSLGPARTVASSAFVSLGGLVVLGLAPTTRLMAVGLVITGFGVGSWDVAMNVEAGRIERSLRRPIMSRFHAGFSIGGIAGAGSGALAALGDVPVAVHLPLLAVVVMVVVLVAVTRFIPRGFEDHAVETPTAAALHDPAATLSPELAAFGVVPDRSAERSSRREALQGQLRAWREPGTRRIGVLVFAMALAEGSANDWLALSLVDGYGASHGIGAAALAVFVAGMTSVRLAGPLVVDRFDHVRVIQVSAALVLDGTGLLIAGALMARGHASVITGVTGFLAALLWGFGAALGFPMGISAAAADADHAETRVAVVTTIGYVAFIVGPPLLGILGQRIGIAQSMIAVTGAVVLAFVTAPAIRWVLPAGPALGSEPEPQVD